MTSKAIVCKLQNVRPHPNASKLTLASVQGYQVILGLDAKDGDLGVFFGPDLAIESEHLRNNNLYRHSYLNANKDIEGYFGDNGKVKPVKLRGEVSEGFWQRIEAFAWMGKFTYQPGEEFNVINGHKICDRYYSKAAREFLAKQGKPRLNRYQLQWNKFASILRLPRKLKFAGKQPKEKVLTNLPEHYDTKQVRDNLSKIPVGAVLYISEKIHGTSGRTGRVQTTHSQTGFKKWLNSKNLLIKFQDSKYEYMSGTRRSILSNEVDYGFYAGTGFRHEIHRRIKEIGLKKGEILFYEIVGFTDKGGLIQPPHSVEDKELKKLYGDKMVYKYGQELGTYGFYVYRIAQINEDGNIFEHSWPQVVARCKALGLPIVPELTGPVIYDGDIDKLLNMLKNLSEGPDVLDSSHIKEGVVARVEHPEMFTALKYKSAMFCILEGIRTNDEAFIDPEQVE